MLLTYVNYKRNMGLPYFDLLNRLLAGNLYFVMRQYLIIFVPN